MKKSFFKVLLIAALAVTTAFSASAFDMETVENAAETETAVQAALAEESTDYVLDANGGEVELAFELGAELTIDTGKSEALCEEYDDGTNQCVKVTGTGYSGVVTVTDGTVTKTVHLYGGKNFKPGLNIFTGTTENLKFSELGAENAASILSIDASYFTEYEGATVLGLVSSGQKSIPFLKNADLDERNLDISVKYTGSVKKMFIINPSTSAHHYSLYWGAVNVWNDGRDNRYTTWQTARNNGGDYPGLCSNAGCRDNTLKCNTKKHSILNLDYVSYDSAKEEAALYIGEWNITPYYKATYMDSDGTTVLGTDYFVCDGTGALLTAYTPDASVLGAKFYTLAADSDEYYPVSAPIALEHKDITLYAYTPDDENVPVNTKQTSIRLAANGKSAGIRFLSYVSAATRANADEYGYIVAREDVLTEAGCTADNLKFGTDTSYMNDGKNFIGHTSAGVKFTGAVNYSKANGIDIVYSTDAETGAINFTGVTVGLDSSYKKGGITYANRYAVRFTTRPYVKIGDLCFYGASTTASLAEKAQALIDGGDTSEELQKIVDQAGKEA